MLDILVCLIFICRNQKHYIKLNRFFFFKEAITKPCFAQCDFSGCVCVLCVYICVLEVLFGSFLGRMLILGI